MSRFPNYTPPQQMQVAGTSFIVAYSFERGGHISSTSLTALFPSAALDFYPPGYVSTGTDLSLGFMAQHRRRGG